MWPFVWRHIGLLLGIIATTLWVGAVSWFVRNDIRRAWRDYQNRWR
jgi:hypothetical protein